MRMIVVGGGQAGRSLARLLLERRHEVCLIEKDRARCQKLADELDAAVFPGDGSTVSVLEAAGARRADCVMAVTGVDQVNLIAASWAAIRSTPPLFESCQMKRANFFVEIFKKCVLKSAKKTDCIMQSGKEELLTLIL